MPPTIGLTLGKYAPLHRGHQYVIETALAEVERLIVVVYDSPSTTRIPLGVRAGWIRALYPSAEVIEAWHTSCPRLPVWEEAQARGLLAREHRPGGGVFISVSKAGSALLSQRR